MCCRTARVNQVLENLVKAGHTDLAAEVNEIENEDNESDEDNLPDEQE